MSDFMRTWGAFLVTPAAGLVVLLVTSLVWRLRERGDR